jgi:hypothetical protein
MSKKFTQLPKTNNLESDDIFPIVRDFDNYTSKGEHIVDFVNKQNDFLLPIKKILTGENTTKTVLNFSEDLNGTVAFHRPYSINLPDEKGWLNEINSVSLNNTSLIQNVDYVFYEDRQIFYFLNNQTTGNAIYTGYCTYNSFPFQLSATKSISNASLTNTTIDINLVTSVTLSSFQEGQQICDFYYDNTINTVFIKNKVDINGGAKVNAKSNVLGKIVLTFNGVYTQRDYFSIPKVFWSSITAVYRNGTLLSPSNYGVSNNILTFSSPIINASFIKIEGITSGGDPANITYSLSEFIGNNIPLPSRLTDLISVELLTVDISPGDSRSSYFCFFVLKNNQSPDNDIIYLGGNNPKYESGTLFIETSSINQKCLFTIDNIFYGNIITIPNYFEDITTLKIQGNEKPVVFDNTTQTLLFTKEVNGNLKYTGTHNAYEGLSNGGEAVEILDEVRGLFATTCGTGQYIHTLATLPPIQNWTSFFVQYYGFDWVAVSRDTGVAIYEDYTPGASKKAKIGYTDIDIKPLTVKLPLASLWSQSRIDDTCLFQVAFSPDVKAPFNSATYNDLDDSLRQAESSMSRGSILTLSNDTLTPVRGVKGIDITGPTPVYYSGSIEPYMILSVYKWFLVKCTNTNGNPKLIQGEKYLLCVNNVQYGDRSILCKITNNNFQIAADLFPFIQ